MVRNIFRKQNTLDEYGYCSHMSTGKDLGDMCSSCVRDREEQWSYKWLAFVLWLPRHNLLWRISFRILHGKEEDDD